MGDADEACAPLFLPGAQHGHHDVHIDQAVALDEVETLAPEPRLRLFEGLQRVALVRQEVAGGPDLVGDEHLVRHVHRAKEVADARLAGPIERRGVDNPHARFHVHACYLSERVPLCAGEKVERQEGPETEPRQRVTSAPGGLCGGRRSRHLERCGLRLCEGGTGRGERAEGHAPKNSSSICRCGLVRSRHGLRPC